MRTGLAVLQQAVQGTAGFSTVGSLSAPSPGNMLRPSTATTNSGKLPFESGFTSAASNVSNRVGSAAGGSGADPTNDLGQRHPGFHPAGLSSSSRGNSAGSGIDDKLAFYQVQGEKIHQLLANEVRRRTEGDKMLQNHIDTKIKEAVAIIEKKFAEKFVQMHVAVDSATKKLEKLQNELAVEREKNVRLTQEMKYFATKGVQDVQDAVTQEKHHRLEEECLLQKKLSEDVGRLQERIDVEKHAREAMLKEAREEIGRASKHRDKSDERVMARLTEDLRTLRANFAAETEKRQRGEEQLAAAMEEIVSQVQLGLSGLVR
jgi:hypothetical protein